MIKRTFIILSLLFPIAAMGQINLTIEGVDSVTTSHNGYEIARTSLTNLIFRNSKISTALDDGFLLMAGDNDYNASTTDKLEGAQIYNSQFIVTNTTPSGSIHGLMVGYNRNHDIHHNFINTHDYGLTREGGYADHTSTINTSGGIYYNIFKDCLYNIVTKGHNGTWIYNNTFYTTINEQGIFVGVKESDTGGITAPYPGSSNTKIKNNIFYYAGSYSQFHAIRLGESGDDTEAEMDTVGFECDYNIYYYTNTTGHKPFFGYNGATLTWEQWRALGYDEHSVILDPQFENFVDFVPASKDLIDIGVDLGSEFEYGLSVDADWIAGEAPSKTLQVGTWQVGARIYETEVIHHADFYVATDGNDSNPGTFEQPWATWGKAFNSTAVQPGDTVYFRGGIYYMTTNNLAYPGTEGEGYNLGRDGTSGNYIHYFNYPGETPILDCGSIIPASNHNRAIYGASDVNYLHFRGLTVRNVYQYSGDVSVIGWGISGDNNIIENCNIYNCGGKGFFATGHEIYYINCDAYSNTDSLDYDMPGNDGVGFTNVDVVNNDGSVYYINCRAWENGDQGFSAISNGYLEFNGCWSFNNGNLEGEGHGFKMGEVGIPPNQPPFGPLKRKYVNCIAAYNRANGWTTKDGDHEVHRMHIYNNLAFYNGHHLEEPWPPLQAGFAIWTTTSTDEEELARDFKNNISIGNEDGEVWIDNTPSLAVYTHSNNSWDGGATIDATDFAALPATQEAGIALLMGARGINGALPSLGSYFRLAEGSDAIDAGINVGLPYDGDAPDLGAFEYDGDIDSTLTDILTFTLPTQTGSATINTTNHTVAIEVNYLATVTNLTPSISVSYGATISPTSMTSRDFSTPQTYTITALDGTTIQEWVVTVTQEEEPAAPAGDSSIVKYRRLIFKL